MDSQATASRFQTTSWTLILRARSSPKQVADVLATYWRPVYGYLRRKGQSRQDAADLTQGFLTKVLEDDLIGRADRDRGKFRTFLLSCLNSFVIDEYRGRRGPRLVPAEPSELDAAEPEESDDPFRAFDHQWAATILQIAIERLRTACESEGLHRHWQVFEKRLLQPVCHGCDPVPVEDLAASLGVADRDEVYSMLYTVKRKFRQILREAVSETVDDPALLDDEVAHLRSLLTMPG